MWCAGRQHTSAHETQVTILHNQCDQIGQFIMLLCDKFSCKKGQNIWWLLGPFLNTPLSSKNCCVYFWLNFWQHHDYFYSNIWSHWLQHTLSHALKRVAPNCFFDSGMEEGRKEGRGVVCRYDYWNNGNNQFPACGRCHPSQRRRRLLLNSIGGVLPSTIRLRMRCFECRREIKIDCDCDRQDAFVVCFTMNVQRWSVIWARSESGFSRTEQLLRQSWCTRLPTTRLRPRCRGQRTTLRSGLSGWDLKTSRDQYNKKLFPYIIKWSRRLCCVFWGT